MTAVPHPHEDTLRSKGDLQVADPLSDEFENLWESTAKRNTQIFQEIFKTVPSNNVRSWEAYQVRISVMEFRSQLLTMEQPCRNGCLKSRLDTWQLIFRLLRSRRSSPKSRAISWNPHWISSLRRMILSLVLNGAKSIQRSPSTSNLQFTKLLA